MTFTASFASAIFSSTVGAISLHYGISTEVATLGVTLYVLGFAAGPTFWAPASELSGRRWPITAGVFGYSIFTVATATAKDVQSGSDRGLCRRMGLSGLDATGDPPVVGPRAACVDQAGNRNGHWAVSYVDWTDLQCGNRVGNRRHGLAY